MIVANHKINEFPGLIVEHLYVKFDDLHQFLSYHTDRHTRGGMVAQRVERWTCDQQVVGPNPTLGKAA